MDDNTLENKCGEKTEVTVEPMGGNDQVEGGGKFFIVGLGGSAGGLEAFEEFFKNLPSDSGMGFVIVTHLDPRKKDILPDLVQRYTNMPVEQAEDGMVIEPDHVYIIPPNKDITLSREALRLQEPSSVKGIRLPIDTFLRSLAEARHSLRTSAQSSPPLLYALKAASTKTTQKDETAFAGLDSARNASTASTRLPYMCRSGMRSRSP